MSNEILQQILGELKNVNQRLSKLEEGQVRLEERQTKLEDSISKLEEGQARLEKKLDIVHDQTANLTEFHNITNKKLYSIAKELNTVEAVTKENLYDITKLKLAR